MADILTKRPELKAILGQTGKEEEFQKLIQTLSDAELAELDTYIKKQKKESELNVWKKGRGVRNVEQQIHVLKQDYDTLRERMQGTQTELQSAFTTVYKNPNSAQQKCWKTEQAKGLEKTGTDFNKKPSAFGSLNGFEFLGISIGSGRTKAKRTAKDTNYIGLRNKFNEDRKVMVWLQHILKGV